MTKEAIFTMKLEPELRAAFMAAAAADDRPASQVVRELMRDYIARQQRSGEYDAYLRRKVETARVSARAGRGRANEQVEAEFVKRRESAGKA